MQVLILYTWYGLYWIYFCFIHYLLLISNWLWQGNWEHTLTQYTQEPSPAAFLTQTHSNRPKQCYHSLLAGLTNLVICETAKTNLGIALMSLQINRSAKSRLCRIFLIYFTGMCVMYTALLYFGLCLPLLALFPLDNKLLYIITMLDSCGS